jgi:transformation/transcription domain-associated protein
MLITNNFESHARKLLSPELSLAQKQQIVTEMRDSIEIVHTSEYPHFLRHLYPAFYRLLSEGQPQFTEVCAGAQAPEDGLFSAASLTPPP